MTNHNPHWIGIDPLKVGTVSSVNLPTVYTFKHKIGSIFFDPKEKTIIEITNYNYIDNCYQGQVTMKIKNGKTTTIHSKLIYEYALDKYERYDSMNDLVEQQKKKEGINYRIHYVEIVSDKKNVKGEKVKHTTITMTGIRPLAKMLNSMKKRNPSRKIIMVSVVDSEGKYLTSVKFLPQEIKEQKFLTGMKERLLAYAKYELGYDIAIGF